MRDFGAHEFRHGAVKLEEKGTYDELLKVVLEWSAGQQ